MLWVKHHLIRYAPDLSRRTLNTLQKIKIKNANINSVKEVKIILLDNIIQTVFFKTSQQLHTLHVYSIKKVTALASEC